MSIEPVPRRTARNRTRSAVRFKAVHQVTYARKEFVRVGQFVLQRSVDLEKLVVGFTKPSDRLFECFPPRHPLCAAERLLPDGHIDLFAVAFKLALGRNERGPLGLQDRAVKVPDDEVDVDLEWVKDHRFLSFHSIGGNSRSGSAELHRVHRLRGKKSLRRDTFHLDSPLVAEEHHLQRLERFNATTSSMNNALERSIDHLNIDLGLSTEA